MKKIINKMIDDIFTGVFIVAFAAIAASLFYLVIWGIISFTELEMQPHQGEMWRGLFAIFSI